VLGVVFFAVYRLLFLLMHRELAAGNPVGDVLYAFWTGFRFDSAILSYIILPLFLIFLLPFFRFPRKRTRIIAIVILMIIFTPVFFICTADLRYFDNFGSRMNFWAVEYLDNPSLYLYSIVITKDFWLLLAVWLLMSALFFLALRTILKKLSRFNLQTGAALKTIAYILAVLLLALGIRGRIGMKGLDWGSAFFSENQFVNQLALNSIFTLSHSIYEELNNGRSLFGSETPRYAFYDNENAYNTTLDMLNIDRDQLTDDSTLEYHTKADSTIGFYPNIVIVIMESWGADMVGALGSKLNVTPAFDSLCARGILFDNFYANGIRTNRGIPAILCSFPSLPGRSIMKRYAADYPFRSVADILDEHGYTSIYAYGGDIEFDNMRGFLKAAGYDYFYDEDGFGDIEKMGKWGLPDHAVFSDLIEKIQTFERPFNLTVMTISNHEPYLIPDDRFKLYDDSTPDSRRLNAFYYSDWSIGRFVEGLRQYPVFDSTIFIFTADHYPHQSAKYPLDPDNFSVPLLIYAPGHPGVQPQVTAKTASHVDIIPIIVGLLGLETEMYTWGRDILSLPEDDSGFAVIVSEEKLGLIEGSKFFFHWVGVGKKLYDLDDSLYLENNLMDSLPDLAAGMEKKLDSYIQLANLLSRGA
jgi:phosphoglycerol transferase MdoB-like AlkP superfamily enzyme